MGLLDEGRGAAHEQLPDLLLPGARGETRRSVVQVTAVGRRVVRAAPLVPVVDVLLRRVGVVGPLRPVRVGIEVVIDNVLDHRDAAAVAGADEVLVLVAPTRRRLDHEVVRVTVSPPDAGELRHRQQLDGIHAEIAQMRKERHRVFQVARPRLAEAQSADV